MEIDITRLDKYSKIYPIEFYSSKNQYVRYSIEMRLSKYRIHEILICGRRLIIGRRNISISHSPSEMLILDDYVSMRILHRLRSSPMLIEHWLIIPVKNRINHLPIKIRIFVNIRPMIFNNELIFVIFVRLFWIYSTRCMSILQQQRGRRNRLLIFPMNQCWSDWKHYSMNSINWRSRSIRFQRSPHVNFRPSWNFNWRNRFHCLFECYLMV